MPEEPAHDEMRWYQPQWWHFGRLRRTIAGSLLVLGIFLHIVGFVALVAGWISDDALGVAEILTAPIWASALYALLRKPFTLAGIKKPICMHCGYDLTGLPDQHKCPECGIQYSFADIGKYKADPEGFREEWTVKRRSGPQDRYWEK